MDAFSFVGVEEYGTFKIGNPHMFHFSEIVGYIHSDPFEIFKKLFPRHFITSYMGVELFSEEDSNAPMKGIFISEIQPVYGVQGDVEGLENYLQRWPYRNLNRTVSFEECKQIQDNLSSDKIPSGERGPKSLFGFQLRKGVASEVCTYLENFINKEFLPI